MKHRRWFSSAWAVAALLVWAPEMRAAEGINPVPQSESFEAYTDGTRIDTVPGWTVNGAFGSGGTVTTSLTAQSGLAAYTNTVGTLPLPAATHEKVLEVDGRIRQRVAGPVDRLVRTDVMIMPIWWRVPEWREDILPPDPAMHVGICFETNGLPVVYHYNSSLGSNEWLTLDPTVGEWPRITTWTSNEWVRLTVLSDYSNHTFQVTLDGGAPIPSDSLGTNRFYMANPTGSLTEIEVRNDGYAYIDDLEIVSDLPEVLTLLASNVTLTTADLVGYLTYTGLAQTAVEVYWGATDGGTEPSAWANTNVWAAPRAPGRYAHTATLASGAVTYCRYAARNSFGLFWATQTEFVVTGSIALDDSARNETAERDADPGVFRFVRPVWTTNVALTVLYAVSGTASNGLDYVYLPGRLTFPADGSTTYDLLVTALQDGIDEGLDPETVVLQLLPGSYVVGSPDPTTVFIYNAQPQQLVWRNYSGDWNWNKAIYSSTSTNWFGSTDRLFSDRDGVTFEDEYVPSVTGRIYVGNATRTGSGWTNATPRTMQPGSLTVISGQYEFEGGAVVGCPANLQGGRVIHRELAQTGFGSDPLMLSGLAEFWRQVPGSATPVLQVFTNAIRVDGTNTLQGAPGTNLWQGAVELKARLNIGVTNANSGVGHVNRFSGTLAVDQDTNNLARRVVTLQTGGGAASLMGSITGSGTVPLWLEVAAGSGNLTLSGVNTFSCPVVVMNSGSANGAVVVAAGSSLGSGELTLAAGAPAVTNRLVVQALDVIAQPLTIPANALLRLQANGAVTAAGSPLTVANSGRLELYNSNCLPDDGTLNLSSNSFVWIASNLVEYITELVVAGVSQPGGSYSRVSGSGKPLSQIQGDGLLTVRGPLPSGILLLVR